MTTISTSTHLGVVLTPSYSDPVVIARGVTVTNTGYSRAVHTTAGSKTAFTVENYGTITGAASGFGIFLAAGTAITNASSASIFGGLAGIYSDSFATVVNAGRVTSGTINSDSGITLNHGGVVTNMSSGTISGGQSGVIFVYDPGTVFNSGQITASLGFGVDLEAGGVLTNFSTGTISVPQESSAVNADLPATVSNSGVIKATLPLSDAVQLSGSSFVTNAPGGVISGTRYGIDVGLDGTVINSGTILNTAYFLFGTIVEAAGIRDNYAGVYVSNAASATIAAYTSTTPGYTYASYGIQVGSGGRVTNAGRIEGGAVGVEFVGGSASASTTLTNAGVIIGQEGTAVAFDGTGHNRLVLEPGFSFTGVVMANASASNALELASGGSAGTVTGLGSELLNFGSIVFDPGAQWLISGPATALVGPISGFSYGDTIQVTGVTVSGSNFSGGILTIGELGGSTTLALSGTFTTGQLVVIPVTGGIDISLEAPCFAAGTRIRTAQGDVPVETLRAGDSVLAHCGDGEMDRHRIVWIGRRSIGCRLHPRPHQVVPVRITAGAFGGALPRRDLLLSPDHAVFVDGVLIPVKYLINGTSIRQTAVDRVTYYHVELADHRVLLAEDLPVESYLDTGNRGLFENGGVAVALHPDFSPRTWDARGCAPLVVSGPALEAVRRRLDAGIGGTRRIRTANSRHR